MSKKNKKNQYRAEETAMEQLPASENPEDTESTDPDAESDMADEAVDREETSDAVCESMDSEQESVIADAEEGSTEAFSEKPEEPVLNEEGETAPDPENQEQPNEVAEEAAPVPAETSPEAEGDRVSEEVGEEEAPVQEGEATPEPEPEPEPEPYVGPNDDIVFEEELDVFSMPPEAPVPITDAHFFLNRRAAPVLNNSVVFLNRFSCNLGKSPKPDRYRVMDRHLTAEYGFLSRIPLKLIWRIAHGEEATAIMAEKASCKKKGKKRGYGLLNADFPLGFDYTKEQWDSDLERITAYIRALKNDPDMTVCMDDIWLLSEFDFQTAFLHRGSDAIRMFQLAILAEARQNENLEFQWPEIRKYMYRVPLERSKGGIFSDEDAARLHSNGIRWLNDIRKYTPYEIKNMLIEHDMCHVVKEINAAFKEDLARRRDRRFRVLPFIFGFINLGATAAVAYVYQYTLIKNQPMTWLIMALLALWALTIPTIIFAAIRAVYRRHTKRKDYYYFIRPVRHVCRLYAFAAAFVILSCVLFYERYDGYDSRYFYRDLDNGTIAIAGRFNDRLTAIEIPETIDGKTVTEIDLFAFFNQPIKTVSLPNTVKSVDRGAFLNCSMLDSVTLNEGLTEIDRHAFRGCARLHELVLPSTLDTLGNDVFRGSALTSADLSVTALTTLPDGAFRSCPFLKTFVGMEQMTEIGNNAFDGCYSLQDVTFSPALESIGDAAFRYCNAFTEITIPNSVTYIGIDALDYCQNLKSVSVPFLGTSASDVENGSLADVIHYERKKFLLTVTVTGDTVIGPEAFKNFNWVTEVILGEGVTAVRENAFRNAENLKKVTFSSSVTELKENAFRGCGALNELVGGDQITTIGNNTFRDCAKLTTLALPALTDIGDGAFRDCAALLSLEGLQNVTTIGAHAFRGCAKLTDVTLSPSLESIGQQAFRGCSSFVNLVVPNSVTSIGWGAFHEMPKLKTVSVPFTGTSAENSAYMPLLTILDCRNTSKRISVTVTGKVSLGWGSFRGCSAVADLTLGEACNGLEDGAFRGLDLRTVTLPAGMQSLPDNVFRNCDRLTEVRGGSLTEIGVSAFAGCEKLVAVDGLSTARYIRDKAFKNCAALPDVTFSETLETVGKEAFRACTAFKTVTLPNSVTSIGRNAFADNTKITAITVPFTGTSLDTSAQESLGRVFTCDGSRRNLAVTVTVMTETSKASFEKCTALESIVFTSPITEIGDNTFENLSVRFVTLPASVKKIGSFAFAGCIGLESVEGADAVEALGEGTFKNCAKLKTFALHQTQFIGNNCFDGCSALADVGQLDFVKEIGAYAFKDCASLKTVVLNSSMQEISDYAFAESGMISMILPEAVQVLGQGAFMGCEAMTAIQFPAGLHTVKAEALRGCKKLLMADLESTTLSAVGEYAFADCAAMTEIRLPATVTVIPEGMAQNCTKLTETTLSQMALTEIGALAFENCSFAGTAVIIPDGLTVIGDKAFYNCDMSAITLPGTMESIGRNAFAACSSLKEAEIPFVGKSAADVRKGYTHVFGTSRVSNLTVTDMTVVESNTFKGAEDFLSTVTLNEGVTEIRNNAFKNFNLLGEVILPESLTVMGASAFENCTHLPAVTIPSALSEIPAKAFKNCTALKALTLTEGSLSVIGKNAFNGCTSLREVTFPEGLVTLESGAFSGCISLNKVIMSDTLTNVHPKAFLNSNPTFVNDSQNVAPVPQGTAADGEATNPDPEVPVPETDATSSDTAETTPAPGETVSE